VSGAVGVVEDRTALRADESFSEEQRREAVNFHQNYLLEMKTRTKELLMNVQQAVVAQKCSTPARSLQFVEAQNSGCSAGATERTHAAVQQPPPPLAARETARGAHIIGVGAEIRHGLGPACGDCFDGNAPLDHLDGVRARTQELLRRLSTATLEIPPVPGNRLTMRTDFRLAQRHRRLRRPCLMEQCRDSCQGCRGMLRCQPLARPWRSLSRTTHPTWLRQFRRERGWHRSNCTLRSC